MLTLKGRTIERQTEPRVGATLLELALAAGADWQFNCSRGTCARCRCLVTEGGEHLAESTDAEWDRLGPDELDAGYRLGCQARVANAGGAISAVNRTYF
ncbi:2Fe-2S iron-sulfur cluster-binding protein [Cohnella rhizosphaerae]|uniref:(2Fe-2S)-binding protein n=1 Tax=Cohnella rhizosphaerae TaxID=1457232 RepID=A0A9X4QW04_9BACL|nr:2Fe-2S iron-sulfur cluster-binding protein [Cohnella rhizosphaerae]MDG0813119.1 (2Fe-2S)-binding protein [Cohnella rhizosphaerae]